TLLNQWHHLRTQQAELGSSAFRRMCRSEHLNYVRVREWFDVHRQLRELTRSDDRRGRRSSSAGARDEDAAPASAADPDAVHRALLSGLLSQIGVLDARSASQDRRAPGSRGGKPRAEYLGARGVPFTIFPGSGL